MDRLNVNLMILLYLLIHFTLQPEDRGSLTVSLNQKPTAGHLQVFVGKAMGLPPPRSEAPGGVGKTISLITLYFL